MMARTVISLCDRTGNMLRPWVRAGYRCIAVDVQHDGERETDGILYVGADVRRYLPPLADYAAAFASPPCTHLAVSGARWFQDKGLGALCEALEIVEACRRICEWTGAPYFVENPISTLATYWRKPDYSFHPWQMAGYPGGERDTYTKKTCLWVGGGFVMPEPRPMPVTDHRIHTMAPSPERADKRAETPMGFAEAVFQANAV